MIDEKNLTRFSLDKTTVTLVLVFAFIRLKINRVLIHIIQLDIQGFHTDLYFNHHHT